MRNFDITLNHAQRIYQTQHSTTVVTSVTLVETVYTNMREGQINQRWISVI